MKILCLHCVDEGLTAVNALNNSSSSSSDDGWGVPKRDSARSIIARKQSQMFFARMSNVNAVRASMGLGIGGMGA